MRIALIAHDNMKDEMVDFAANHEFILAKCKLLATGTTGRILNEKLKLDIERMASGPLGGDQMIGSEIAKGNVDCVIFLRDPLTAQPHEPDITALLRICDVHNVPLATNRNSADLVLKGMIFQNQLKTEIVDD